jgi:hypothetical protein
MRLSLLRSATALVLLGLSIPAIADTRIEIEGGRSYSDSHGTNVGFVEALFDAHTFGSSNFTWAPDASVGFIDGRKLARYGNAVSDDVWLLAGGVRIRYGNNEDWYHHLFWTSQVAIQAGRTLALSSGGEFVNSVGWQGDRWSFQVRHVSNAGIKGSNRGETMALVGLAFNL